jgi:hypothetical protein
MAQICDRTCTAYGTVSVTEVECVKPPPVPVMVSGYAPDFGFFAGAVTVNVEVSAAGFGANDAVNRGGMPETVKFTLLENPPDRVIVTVYVAFPAATVCVAGLAASEKSP